MAGTHVVTTRSGSIPEVGGKVVEYFDPGDSEELARKMVALLSKGDGASTSGPQVFTWAKTAENTLSSLTSAIQG